MSIAEITKPGLFLTPDDLESIYGIPKGTQAVWRCTGRYALPYIKVGRNVRYRREAIEEWLKGRERGGSSASAAAA